MSCLISYDSESKQYCIRHFENRDEALNAFYIELDLWVLGKVKRNWPHDRAWMWTWERRGLFKCVWMEESNDDRGVSFQHHPEWLDDSEFQLSRFGDSS
jgi:hypothetical protein